MEQQRDEQIPCADCGASFVFSASEAAVFAERGLTPPKRCKECRRARKDRAAQGGGAVGPAPRHGAPHRYTGDVNEYRSPMGDTFSGSPYGAPARGGAWQGSGEYRSPMPDGNLRRLDGDRRQAGHAGHAAGHAGGHPQTPQRAPREGNFRNGPGRPAAGRSGPGRSASSGARVPRVAAAPPATAEGAPPAKPARKRPAAELFPITCNTCGAQAEVPFKPAEGREVFCPACYRARRPST
jgi:CxxC-x17-CxxC domain-containing protein